MIPDHQGCNLSIRDRQDCTLWYLTICDFGYLFTQEHIALNLNTIQETSPDHDHDRPPTFEPRSSKSALSHTPCWAELATSHAHPQDFWNSQVVAEDSEPATVSLITTSRITAEDLSQIVEKVSEPGTVSLFTSRSTAAVQNRNPKLRFRDRSAGDLRRHAGAAQTTL